MHGLEPIVGVEGHVMACVLLRDRRKRRTILLDQRLGIGFVTIAAVVMAAERLATVGQ